MQRFRLASCVLLFSSLISFGQNPGITLNIESDNYTVLNWTSEHGLPQNSVHDLAEDHNGMIWVSTFEGLVRFDGSEFKIYDKHNTPEMTESAVTSVHVDSKGAVWFATPKELIRIQNGDFSSYPLGTDANVRIFEYKNNIFTYDVYGIYTKNGTRLPAIKRVFGERLISAVITTESDILYIHDHQIYRAKDSTKFCEGQYNHIGLNHVINTETKEVFTVTENGLEIYTGQLKSPNRITSFEDGYILTGRIDSLCLYNALGERLFESAYSELGTTNMSTAHKSDNGIIWFGSMDNGIYVLYPKRFKSISRKHPDIGSTGNFVYQSPDESIWIDGYCRERFSTKDFGKTMVRHETSICTWSMIVDRRKNVWALTLYGGIIKNGIPVHGDFKTIGIRTYSIFESSTSRLLIGTNSGVYEIVSDTFNLLENSVRFGDVYSFYEDRNGQILFCSSTGVGGITENKVERKKFIRRQYDVRSLYQDRDLNYWIGTAGDGMILHNSKGTFGFSKLESVPKDIWCILEDDKGFFWINTNNGIFRMSRKGLLDYRSGRKQNVYSIRFGRADGLINSEGNSRTQNKAFVDPNGNFWFSTIAGPVWIDPLIVDQTKFNNPILLDEVQIDNKLVDKDDIVVTADKNFIQFKFSQANFLNTKHLGYKYRVKGLNKGWVAIGKAKIISLNELPAGEFVLEIRQDGTNITTSVPFKVENHFYESKLFLIGAGIVGTIVFALILLFIWRSYRKGKRTIQDLSDQLNNLKLKALQSQMNPHFIFNCLNSIQSLYIIGETGKANKYMSRFSTLLRTILNHSDQKEVTIQDEIDMYNVYIPLESLQLNNSFTYNIELDKSINPTMMLIPSMITHTYIENAIKHGLKPLKSRKGRLLIKISRTKEHIVFEIQDNGIGIDGSQRLKKEAIIKHDSKGTRITQDRIDLINIVEELDVSVKMEQLSNATGTRIKLHFPIKFKE